MRPTRPLPQRTCVACRSTTGKRELVRVVRKPDGSVAVDLSGKQAGRGAYLCHQRQCWEAALKRDRLGAALKTKIGAADRQRLVDFASTIEAAPDAETPVLQGREATG